MSVKEIESAIAELSRSDLSELSQWMQEYVADLWDREIETDMAAGRFQKAGQRAIAEFEAGKCQPL